jgi:DNA-binding NarL/FixJ family response regulator
VEVLPYHIIIADSQYLVRETVKDILQKRYSLVEIVESKDDLFVKLDKFAINLVIFDFKLFDFDSMDEIIEMKRKFPSTKFLILSNTFLQTDISELSCAGYKNFLLKTTDESEFCKAVELTFLDKKSFSADLMDLILDTQKRNISEDFGNLTAAEMEIVKLIADGLTTKQIAAGKFISFHTVMTHRKNIFRKLKVNSASELIILAIRKGWIDNIEYYI